MVNTRQQNKTKLDNIKQILNKLYGEDVQSEQKAKDEIHMLQNESYYNSYLYLLNKMDENNDTLNVNCLVVGNNLYYYDFTNNVFYDKNLKKCSDIYFR